MPHATHASLTLARFESPRTTGPVETMDGEGVLFLGAAADVRAALSDAKSQQAFSFAMLGLHDSESSARRTMAAHEEHAPWMSDAVDVWSAVMQPFRHFGEANFIDPASPGPLYGQLAATPPDDKPIVIMTSVGWNASNGLDWERIQRFSDAVAAVRIGMTGMKGLHSQQSFSFPGGLVWDGITVTFWRNLAAAMAFAYGPGFHRSQVKAQREENLGDRTSFTRFSVLDSKGTWYGCNPLEF